jgi:hypothetical protein
LLSKNKKLKICNIIILPVVVYGCETWCLILREEYKLRVFEKRLLRRIFGPKWEGVTDGWRNLHNEELHELNCSPSIISNQVHEDEVGGACGTIGGEEGRV